MNYYMPYFNMYPNMISNVAPTVNASKGIFSSLFGRLNWGSILSNTQKTLNLVNQAIPVIKQVSPVMKNAKTMFKVMNEFKRIDSPAPNTKIKSEEKDYGNTEHTNTTIDYDGNSQAPQFDGSPTFFVN